MSRGRTWPEGAESAGCPASDAGLWLPCVELGSEAPCVWSHLRFCCCGLVAQPCPTLVIPWTVAHQVPLSMRFPRQEDWSGLLFSSPGHLPDPRIRLMSPAWQADSLPLCRLGSHT